MKKLLAMILVFSLAFMAVGCGNANKTTGGETNGTSSPNDSQESSDQSNSNKENGQTEESAELIVFAAASMTEAMEAIKEMYKEVVPNVTITYNFDSSGTLLTQIQEGADCDIFISASPKQMNALDGTVDSDGNANETKGDIKEDAEGDVREDAEGERGEEFDFLLPDTRVDLLENKVVLSVPEGNPAGIKSFDDMIEKLKAGSIMLAMGNQDVPVGQYTGKIFQYYNLKEEALANTGVLTYGSNVKEVTTQISEGTVDCGIIYQTDAFSADLAIIDNATKEMCGQVIYPAAILNITKNESAAKSFLAFLETPEALKVFEAVGFTPIN